MPELPEVETTVRGIAPYLEGQSFDFVRVYNSSLRWPIPSDLSELLTGARCKKIYRRAKYICIETSVRPFLAHLGMSGSLRLVNSLTPLKPHDHVSFGVGSWELRYHDPRRFGCLLWSDSDRASQLLRALGPEPLSDEFDGSWLYRQSRKRSVSVKHFLMTNSVVVGVGNIYASESLFLAGILPARSANRISLARYEILAKEIKSVLMSSIEAGGTTLRDFVSGKDEPGYFQQALNVYGRAGLSCFHCERVIKSRMIGGRNSFYCPSCQR
ncbi:bifunctional DNA-formamidopyrimidine glycosylase/DNA-(apurinic or apyrimidinic site) lyase [Litorivicinus sp.]|nr:bifunctional DNA-formamidopyrimidine glycosylase/DNA-(apurinic or apyrimidinic site) lyase [Litorivicinus sp.]